MTLEQLRIFVATAGALSMTRAAEYLRLTQPAVSAAVAALEARHSVRLFDRVGRRLELTEAGRVLYSEAESILARVPLRSALVAARPDQTTAPNDAPPARQPQR